MYITRSTSIAGLKITQALQSSKPLIHLVTDSFAQVMQVMESSYFKRNSNKTDNNQKDEKDEESYRHLTSVKIDDLNNNAKKIVLYATLSDSRDMTQKNAEIINNALEISNRKLLSSWFNGSQDNICVVFYGRNLTLPPLLEVVTTRIEFPPLDTDDFNSILKSHGIDNQELAEWYKNQLAGFTEAEILSIFENIIYGPKKDIKAKLEHKNLYAEPIIRREKNLRLLRHGKLKCIEAHDSGTGCSKIRSWLETNKKNILRSDFKDSDDVTKGILLVGLPGTGKSRIAKAAAAILGLPLISLQMSSILGGRVGDSEHNMAEVIDDLTVAGAPCVLWIDECEKAMSGVSGNNDSGVMSRVFGALLTFMQEMKKTIFVIATCNDITRLPPEFSRSGRIDNKFRLLLPSYTECVEIMQGKLKHHFSGYNNETTAQNLLNICSGAITAQELLKGMQDSNKQPYRFFSGADINKLAKDMCILMGHNPGTDYSEPITSETISEMYTHMEEAIKNTVVSFDARSDKNVKDISKQYLGLISEGQNADERDIPCEWNDGRLSVNSNTTLCPYDEAMLKTLNKGIALISKDRDLYGDKL